MPSSRARRLVLAVGLSLGLASFALAAQTESVQEDPIERKVLEIAKHLRCAVCQNQPVSESNADLAKDMRVIIREQVIAGKSQDEIIDYFVQRYGDYVLLKPPFDAAGTVVWLVPPLVFIVLAISAFFFLRQRARRSVPPPPSLSEEDRARVRAARQQE